MTLNLIVRLAVPNAKGRYLKNRRKEKKYFDSEKIQFRSSQRFLSICITYQQMFQSLMLILLCNIF